MTAPRPPHRGVDGDRAAAGLGQVGQESADQGSVSGQLVAHDVSQLQVVALVVDQCPAHRDRPAASALAVDGVVVGGPGQGRATVRSDGRSTFA